MRGAGGSWDRRGESCDMQEGLEAKEARDSGKGEPEEGGGGVLR